ncbi:MAG TPA: DUF3108 domain-containing protein [Rhizobiaceae bacterium]|nr:DUF3108 domain-containing protein [Rhizobiaceae bacterium]
MRFAPALAVSISFVLAQPSQAAQPAPVQTFTGEYAVTYLGLTLAESTVTTTLKGNRLTARGSMASAGLARLFDKTTADISVRAIRSKTGIVPQFFRLTYQTGKKKKQLTEIRFAKGDVNKTINKPALRKRDKKTWVPVGAKELRTVFDPFTAAIVMAPSLGEVCKRTIRAYDGEMRSDLVLSHKAYGEIDIPGYAGKTVTCSAKYKPVAGYRNNRKELISLRDKTEIDITFAPLATTGLYVPVMATADTEIGTVRLRARRTELTN